jgi:uncharacterized protein (TIGR03437 family)
MNWTITLYLLAAALAAQAQTLTTLATFDRTNGAEPNSLVQGADGNFYGITSGGGSGSSGIVFKLTPAGVLTTLYSFTGFADASQLVQAGDGSFYGTTLFGGPMNWGTIYKVTPSGSFTTLYNFLDMSGDYGINPNAGLVQATDGNFYGTTSAGGYHADNGTVFKFALDGTSTTLHSFEVSDGFNPTSLIQATDGNFYGTTARGGAGSCPGDAAVGIVGGCGTIFKITPDGALTTLYSFGVATAASGTPVDGASPSGPLIQGSDGNFYGTTPTGGIAGCQDNLNVVFAANGCGTIFKITPAGNLTTLHSFGATPTDGANPVAGLIQATDGNFYGTSAAGGTGGCQNLDGTTIGCGTIFSITPAGSYTTLYRFGANYILANKTSVDGVTPQAPLIQASDGNLYGTASAGGAYTYGTVFKFSFASPDMPAIAPTGGVLNGASFQPGISPGSWITINGINLSSTTDTWANSIVNGTLPTMLDGVSVMVGNQPAYIEYISPTQINAVVPNVAPNVPAGPVPVTVTTASGTSQAVTAQLTAEQPAFFQWGTYAVATRQDFSLAVKNGTFEGTTTVSAAPGDVIILWGTGFGPTSPPAPAGQETPSTTTLNTANTVSVTVGGKPAIVYGAALAPGYAGLYQVAIQIPLSLANGDYPVVATINRAQSPSTTLITVQK